MTLGQKLRQMRLARGMTQSQVAGDRITRNMLSQIENDLAKPSLPTLEYLAQVLEVSVGWLMADENADSPTGRLSRARTLLRAEDYAACMATLNQEEPEDEEQLMLSVCACRLARQALGNEEFERALDLAKRALDWNQNALYRVPGIQVEASAVIARCAAELNMGEEEAVTAYRDLYLQQQHAVQYHMLMARYHLEQEHVQAAEREIWSISDLPDGDRAEYLILRGKLATKKEQYENAALYLQQAESLQPLPKLLQRELYQCQEVCSRELGDFKQAYEYLSRQRELL